MEKKEKLRQCISCRVKKPREELIRITKTYNSNEIVINPNKYQLGRSAYICKNPDCIKKANKEKKIGKMLRVKKEVTV